MHVKTISKAYVEDEQGTNGADWQAIEHVDFIMDL